MPEKIPFNSRDEAIIFLEDKNLIYIHESFYGYKDGFYQLIVNDAIKNVIQIQLNDEHHSSVLKVEQVFKAVKFILSGKSVDLDESLKYVNCKNGILNIRTFEFLPHSPDIIFLYKLKVNYNESLKCPTFLKFINDVFVNGDYETDLNTVDYIHKFIGYCFYPKIKFDNAMVLLGQGSNGKSIFMYIIEHLFEGVVSQVRFDTIGTNQFRTSGLIGKMLNISPELDSKTKISGSEIKAIISGDTITVEKKHKDAFSCKLTTKHIVTANNLPASSDNSYGFYRRFDIIPFRQKFLDKIKDREEIKECDRLNIPYRKADDRIKLEKNLREELDGIFLWAINGLKKLMKDGRFPSIDQTNIVRNMLREDTDTTEMFIESCLEPFFGHTPYVLVCDEYKKFCNHLNLVPQKNKYFKLKLKEAGIVVAKYGNGGYQQLFNTKLKEQAAIKKVIENIKPMTNVADKDMHKFDIK